MRPLVNPYDTPEFLRSRIVIPHDYETEILAERQDEARAKHLFALRVVRQRRRAVVLRAVLFSVAAFIALFIGASL